VAETLGLSALPGYSTGGTLHVIINANPAQGRSSVYCSDLAKSIQAPIFHVNGDDVETVVQTMTLAFNFLRRFQKNVVVDLVCYRRHGHNETDEPSFTQPGMYQAIQAIAKHATTRALYEIFFGRDQRD